MNVWKYLVVVIEAGDEHQHRGVFLCSGRERTDFRRQTQRETNRLMCIPIIESFTCLIVPVRLYRALRRHFSVFDGKIIRGNYRIYRSHSVERKKNEDNFSSIWATNWNLLITHYFTRRRFFEEGLIDYVGELWRFCVSSVDKYEKKTLHFEARRNNSQQMLITVNDLFR